MDARERNAEPGAGIKNIVRFLGAPKAVASSRKDDEFAG